MAEHVIVETRDEWERRKERGRRKQRKKDPYFIAIGGFLFLILGIMMYIWSYISFGIGSIISVCVGLILMCIGYLDYKLQRRG